MVDSSLPVPPLRDFVARRFATHSPFWSWLVFERAGGALAYVFARLGRPSPSTVTVLGGLSGVCGAVLLGRASDGGEVVLSAVLLLLGYTLDCADGQLARATGRTSARGAWLDVTIDAVIVVMLASSLSAALAVQDDLASWAFVLACAFGASRVASIFTATRVRESDDGGIHLTGAGAVARRAYGAVVDTPFVYALLCATRLSPTALRTALVAITALTVVRTLISARHHFRTAEAAPKAVTVLERTHSGTGTP